MSTVNANVVSGKVFVKDANGQALLTVDDVNLLGVPTVTVDLADELQAADLKDALADLLLTATATVSAEATNVVTVTVQILDAKAGALADQVFVEFYLSDAAGGAITADTFTGGGVAASTGTICRELVTDTHCLCLTDAAGALVLTFTETGANVLYFNLRLQDIYVAGSIAMTWTA